MLLWCWNYMCFLQHGPVTHWTNQFWDGHCGHCISFFFLLSSYKKKSNRSDACQCGHKFQGPPTPFFPDLTETVEKKTVFLCVGKSWPLLHLYLYRCCSLLLSGILSFTASVPPNHPYTSQPPNSIRPGAAVVEGQGGGGPKGLSESAEK